MAPTKSAKKIATSTKEFLATIGEAGKSWSSKKQTIFTQGDAADSVFFIQEGKVSLTVVSKIGKEATWHIEQGRVFGEVACRQPLRMGSATAMTDCELMRIEKKAMMLALHQEHTLSTCLRHICWTEHPIREDWWTNSSIPAKETSSDSALAGSLRARKACPRL